MLDDVLARANSVCLPALSRSDRPVLALLLVAGVDNAVLYCAVRRYLIMLGDHMLEYTHSHVVRTKKSPANNKKSGEDSSSAAEHSTKRNGKGSFRQAIRQKGGKDK